MCDHSIFGDSKNVTSRLFEKKWTPISLNSHNMIWVFRCDPLQVDSAYKQRWIWKNIILVCNEFISTDSQEHVTISIQAVHILAFRNHITAAHTESLSLDASWHFLTFCCIISCGNTSECCEIGPCLLSTSLGLSSPAILPLLSLNFFFLVSFPKSVFFIVPYLIIHFYCVFQQFLSQKRP